MKVEFETITLQKLNIQQLEEVIEHTFGFHYDICENEDLLEEGNIEYEVTPHSVVFDFGAKIQCDRNNPLNYFNELNKIQFGQHPEKHSLHIILNELCERGQIDEGNYFIKI